MPASAWITVPADVVAATILLYAASTKLVAPDALARVLHRLTNSPALSSAATVRTVGTIEAVVALLLLFEPSRLPASALLVLLGLSFAALGTVGWVRKLDEPCGCFGAASQQPLGVRNVLLGLLFAVVGAANLATADRLAGDNRAAPPLLAAALLCLACLGTGRELLQKPLEPSS